jgi:hypothetical protein
LPESRFDLQHAGSPSKETALERRRKPISAAGRLVPVELAEEIAEAAGTELWAGGGAAGRVPDRGAS